MNYCETIRLPQARLLYEKKIHHCIKTSDRLTSGCLPPPPSLMTTDERRYIGVAQLWLVTVESRSLCDRVATT